MILEFCVAFLGDQFEISNLRFEIKSGPHPKRLGFLSPYLSFLTPLGMINIAGLPSDLVPTPKTANRGE
jgi:hypothetical protein